VAYSIEFSKPGILTREDYDSHADELDVLKKLLYEEMNRLESIRRGLNLRKVRFRVRAEVD